MNYYDIFLLAAVLVGACALFWLGGYARKVLNSKWRLCYAAPGVLCLILAALSGFEVSMLGAYAGAAVLLGGFVSEKEPVRKRVSAAALALTLLSAVACQVNPGYRKPDYVKDFEKGFAVLREHYVLGEHKGIEWDALHEKYLPRFQAAEAAHDEKANFIAWTLLCQEFYDGHVAFSAGKSELEDAALEEICGNDYGLSLMTLSDGRTAAVNVQEDGRLSQAGIHNGTIITAWDGQSIDEAAAQQEGLTVMSFPDEENEAFYRALLIAGQGGSEVKISYLDDSGKACEVTAPKLGSYYQRLKDTIDIIDQGYEAGNLSLTQIGDDAYVLRVKSMMYDTDSMKSGDYANMQSELREQFLTIREQVKEIGARQPKLIVDLRSNGGGSGEMVMALGQLLAPEGEHYYVTDGVFDEEQGRYRKDEESGKYMTGTAYTYQGENAWNGGEIILLVNAESASAADHFTKVMQGMEHVTVMGFTKTNGSAQGITAAQLESGTLVFSASLMLDQDGSVFIDSGTDRKTGDGIDIKVPFDEEAVRALFDDGQDYLLQKALDYK